ncbi:hypothetical protein [uncultured Parvibaculum sp.]|uniref:hypothetical protein n=1 Tax=uncultured Parvibaculum sp. TaxID=291828 RepID=UPI0030DDBDA9|tara:strand:- start:101492 stop:101758 length:267 start_codon:yes stop_codon:yes gene_type:complete
MQNLSIERSAAPRNLRYARPAWRSFLRLGAGDRARVRAFAEAAPGLPPPRLLAPGLLSCRAGGALRIVYSERAGVTTVLALTGGSDGR